MTGEKKQRKNEISEEAKGPNPSVEQDDENEAAL